MVASALTFCFFLQQSFCLQVLATNISGVIGKDGVYNIDPTATNGGIGYRKYNNFDLSQGDIANLIFHDQSGKDINTFLNLVDNQINIQGIVNALNNEGNFTNGHAVFISPNGMVVGASGVLNVGSLTVLTPDSESYEKYKSDVAVPSLTSKYEQRLGKGTATVNIDGRIAARDFVNINAADVNISEAAMIVGMSNSPSKYNPVANYDLAIQKRDSVLKKMYKNGVISEAEMNEAMEDPLLVVEKRTETLNESYQVSYAIYSAVLTLMEQNGFEFQYTFKNKEEYEKYKEHTVKCLSIFEVADLTFILL